MVDYTFNDVNTLILVTKTEVGIELIINKLQINKKKEKLWISKNLNIDLMRMSK